MHLLPSYSYVIVVRFTAGGNIATTLTVLALVISGFMLRNTMNATTSTEEEATLLNYKGFDFKGIPVSLGVMAYCKCFHSNYFQFDMIDVWCSEQVLAGMEHCK